MNQTSRLSDWITRYHWMLVFVVYLIVCLILDSPFLFFHQTLYLGDWTHAIEPVLRYVRDMYIAHGRIYNWIPSVLCGAPVIQVAWPFHYIPGWLYMLVPFDVATGLFLLLHQLIAGTGAYWWHYLKNNNCETRVSESFLFGYLFMLSGYMVGSTTTTAILATIAWIPVNLLTLDQIMNRPRLWCLGALALTVGLQISAGRPGLIAVSVCLYTTYCIFSLTLSGGKDRSVVSTLFSLLITGSGFALALAYAAHVVIPLFEMVLEAPNVQMFNVMNTMRWSAGWFDFLGLLLMKPFEVIRFHLYPTYPDEFPYITSLYLGAPVLSLSLLGFSDRTWKYRWFWASWALLSGALAAGEFSFLYPFLLNLCRDLSLFRFPIKLAIFLILPVSLAAVRGWRCVLSHRADKLLLWSLAGIWAFLFVAGGILYMLSDEPWAQILHGLGITSRAFALNPAAGAILSPSPIMSLSDQELAWTRRLPLELMLAGLTGFIPCVVTAARWKGEVVQRLVWLAPVCFLIVVNGTHHLWDTVHTSFYKHGSEVARWIVNRTGQNTRDFRVLTAYRESTFLIPPVCNHLSDNPAREYWQYVRNILSSNCNIDFGIRLTNGKSVTPSWNMFFYVLGPLHSSCLVNTPASSGFKSDLSLYRWCQATSTKFLTSYMYTIDYAFGKLKLTDRLAPEYFDCVLEDENLNLRIYEIADVCPRISLQSNYRLVLKRLEALRLMGIPQVSGYDPQKEVLVSARFPEYETQLKRALKEHSLEPGGQKHPQGTVRLVEETPDSLELHVKTAEPAFLVIRDTYHKGWVARDNNLPARIHIADGLFRAIFLEAGTHKVRLEFKPAAIQLGALVSILSFLAILGLIGTSMAPRLR